MNELSHPEIAAENRIARHQRATSTAKIDETLRDRIRALRDNSAGEWSNGSIGNEVGYSDTVISLYVSKDGNKYNGDIAALERKLREFLRDQALKLDSGVPTIECEISQQICEAIEEIRTAKRIGVIIGAPGFGKSRGLDFYCSDHELAILMRANTWRRNLAKCIEICADAVDVRCKRGAKAAESIAEKLGGSSRPLIADDAHKLTRGALQFLYDLRDDAGNPIVLVGDQRLITKLEDDGQRLRRTGIVYHLKLRDPRPLVKHHIAVLAPDANGETADLTKLCVEIAKQKGHFGSVQMELSLAARFRSADPDLSWCECVKRAHTRLIRDYLLEVK